MARKKWKNCSSSVDKGRIHMLAIRRASVQESASPAKGFVHQPQFSGRQHEASLARVFPAISGCEGIDWYSPAITSDTGCLPKRGRQLLPSCCQSTARSRRGGGQASVSEVTLWNSKQSTTWLVSTYGSSSAFLFQLATAYRKLSVLNNQVGIRAIGHVTPSCQG